MVLKRRRHTTAIDNGADIALGACVVEGASLAEGVVVAPGAVIHDDVRVGAGSLIGSTAVLLPGTEVGADCVVEAGAIVGKRPQLRPGSSAAGKEFGPLRLGPRVTVCAAAVVYAGAQIAAGAIIGDQSQVRELVEVGPSSVLGRGSTLDQAVRVGARVLIQTSVYLCGGTIVEDDVFIGPGVITTNDNTMDRLSPGQALQPPVFRRGCRVGANATLVPGITIGEDAYVAAGAVVTHEVGEREVVMGTPARVVGTVSEADAFRPRANRARL